MKTINSVSLIMASLLLSGSVLLAEPGNFGVNGAAAWNGPVKQRIKHTDSFGDTYYTYSYREPESCVTDAVKKYARRSDSAPKEVLDGLKATFDAAQALRLKQDKRAEEDLEHAQAEFQAAFKAVPELEQDLPPDRQAPACIPCCC